MYWQRPGSDCHKVTAGFSNAFEVDTIRATMVPRSGGGGGGGCLQILCNYDCLSTGSLTEPGTAL